MSSERIDADVVVEYGFATDELNLFWKIAQMWWIIPKSRVLRVFLVTDQGIYVEMWDGQNYCLEPGTYEAKYSRCSREGDLRTIGVQTDDGQKFKIREMTPMYPNGEADYDMVVRYLGAEETGWSAFNRWCYDARDKLSTITG